MSHLSEFREQQAVTPGPRKNGNVKSAWECYTTASKTARVYRSVAKTANRQISYAVDLIAANEEMEHPESLDLVTNIEWTVYKVSPLWNVQYKGKKSSRINESDFSLGERQDYDASALKRYAAVIRSFLLKDCSDFDDLPSSVCITPLRGLRGSRNDKDALKIEVFSVLGEKKRSIFTGILCGVEVATLQITGNNATCLPVLLTHGSVDLTERVIYGLSKCFECVISHLLFPKYELLYATALWTALEDANSSFDCSIAPPSKRKQRQVLQENSSTANIDENTQQSPQVSTQPTTAGKEKEEDIELHLSIPDEHPHIRDKISSIKISLSFSQVGDLWRAIHDPRENTVTEQEMNQFHEILNELIRNSLGIIVEALSLDKIKLPHISVTESGKIKIQNKDHVKKVLRDLTAMCHGNLLVANPSLGIAEESMADE